MQDDPTHFYALRYSQIDIDLIFDLGLIITTRRWAAQDAKAHFSELLRNTEKKI